MLTAVEQGGDGDAGALAWAIRHCGRAAAHGFPIDQLLRDSHVADVDAMGRPKITSNHLALLCLNTIVLLDDEFQGSARHGLPAGLMAMGVRVMLGADRLDDGIRHFLRFCELASPSYRGKLETIGDSAILSLEIDRDPAHDLLPGEETLIAGMHMYMSWFAGRTVPIVSATTRCADNPALSAGETVFIRSATRLANRTSIEFPKACLGWDRRANDHDRPVSQSLRFAMDHVWSAQTFAFGYKARAGEGSYAASVLRLIEEQPTASVAEVSDALGVTPITLWRYLKNEGTSFLRLRRSWLVQRAVDRLRHTETSVEALSDELGFSDARALRQSIKTLTGMTPSEIRSGSNEIGRFEIEQEAVRQRVVELGERLET